MWLPGAHPQISLLPDEKMWIGPNEPIKAIVDHVTACQHQDVEVNVNHDQ
jgi:hypothetical protein